MEREAIESIAANLSGSASRRSRTRLSRIQRWGRAAWRRRLPPAASATRRRLAMKQWRATEAAALSLPGLTSHLLSNRALHASAVVRSTEAERRISKQVPSAADFSGKNLNRLWSEFPPRARYAIGAAVGQLRRRWAWLESAGRRERCWKGSWRSERGRRTCGQPPAPCTLRACTAVVASHGGVVQELPHHPRCPRGHAWEMDAGRLGPPATEGPARQRVILAVSDRCGGAAQDARGGRAPGR